MPVTSPWKYTPLVTVTLFPRWRLSSLVVDAVGQSGRKWSRCREDAIWPSSDTFPIESWVALWSEETWLSCLILGVGIFTVGEEGDGILGENQKIYGGKWRQNFRLIQSVGQKLGQKYSTRYSRFPIAEFHLRISIGMGHKTRLGPLKHAVPIGRSPWPVGRSSEEVGARYRLKSTSYSICLY